MDIKDIKQVFDFIKNVLSPIIKALGQVYEKLPIEVRRRKSPPKLGLIESAWRNHSWVYGMRGNEKVVMLDTNWHITNTLPYNLTTLNAFLREPEYTKGSIMLKDVNSRYWGHYTIPREYTTEMGITFQIDQKFVKDKKTVIKAKIDLQDPTGKIHKIDSVMIYPSRSNEPVKAERLEIEDSSKIKSKIIKQVVAVLKNEIQQYKVRGRREGRLGTVEWPRGTMEYREVDSKIQFLYENSSKGNVSSEHLESLLNLYRKFSNHARKLTVKSLLSRIDKRSEYRDVGYFIIFCLFEMGHLKVGLNRALQNLEGDRSNGFGDVLRIIDILLTYRYEEFQEPELTVIENFISSTKEQSFSIRERINAIRIRRMNS